MSWAITILAAWYVAWTGYSLASRVPTFRELFAGLGAEVPWLTKAVFLVCIPEAIWPVTLTIVAVLVIKEVKLERVGTKVLISTMVFMATASFAAVVTEALYRPMFRLIEQIK